MSTQSDLSDFAAQNLKVFEKMVPGIHQRLLDLTPGQKRRAEGSEETTAWTTRFTLEAPRREKVDQYVFRFVQGALDRATAERIGFLETPRSSSSYFLMILGVGSDVDLEDVIERTSSLCVFIIEPDMGALWRSMERVDWYAVMHRVQKRKGVVHFLYGDDPDEISSHVWRLIRATNPCTSDGLTCMTHDHRDLAQKVISNLKIEANLVIDSLGHFYDERLMLWNAYQNLAGGGQRVYERSPAGLCRPVPAFIVASGPSLDNDLATIRELSAKAVIISCGSALRVLLQNDIVPDFQIELENIHVVPLISQVAGEHDLSPVCLIAASTVDPEILDYFERIVFSSRFPLSSHALLSGTEKETFRMPGPTVVNAALCFAQETGFQDIYMFGTDFGAKRADGLHHAKDSYYYTDDPLIDPEDINYRIPVEGNFGGQYLTSRGLYRALINFADIINIDGEGPNYVNCSDGAAIMGTSPVRSKDISLPEVRADKNRVVEEMIEGFPVFTGERFHSSWDGPAMAKSTDIYLDSIIGCLEAIDDFDDKTYFLPLMEIFQPMMGYMIPPQKSVSNAVNILLRGTTLGMFIFFEFYLARVADPGRAHHFGEIARGQFIAILEELRKTAKEGLGGTEPIEPPPFDTITAGPHEKFPMLAHIPRNMPCPCGSGKRFKICHGKPIQRG